MTKMTKRLCVAMGAASVLVSVSLPGSAQTRSQPVTASGAPCATDFRGYSREASLRNYFDHFVSAKNDCGQVVRVKVCYEGTVHCSELRLPPHGEGKVNIGIKVGEPKFRFSWSY